MQHGMMLDVGGDYVVSAPPLPKGNSPEGGVIGLAPAAGENHLAGPASQDAGHRLPGLIQRLPRLLGQHVQAGGVPELLGEIGKHGLHNLRANRRSGRVIHIYHTGILLHRDTQSLRVTHGQPLCRTLNHVKHRRGSSNAPYAPPKPHCNTPYPYDKSRRVPTGNPPAPARHPQNPAQHGRYRHNPSTPGAKGRFIPWHPSQ